MESFIKKLSKVNEAKSVSGRAFYHSIDLKGGKIYYTRESTGNTESIYIDDLYSIYSKEEFINTKIIKEYIDRKQSPGLAILIAAGLYDKNGNKK